MIGTPNRGSPVADHFVSRGIIICDPAVYDLLSGSDATIPDVNTNTKYHTIASDWTTEYAFPFVPSDTNCPAPLSWFDYNEWSTIAFQKWARDQVISGPDDGLVPLESADPGGPFFKSLGHTNNCHTNLFTQEELDKAFSVLNP
jgi:hypothetical protein